jgi:hypothetical protein
MTRVAQSVHGLFALVISQLLLGAARASKILVSMAAALSSFVPGVVWIGVVVMAAPLV